MVGIGKTALAKSVYESQELSCMFEQRAWVSVMRPFNLDNVLASLDQKLKVGKGEESVKPLNGIGCIIVLDGVLSTEEWKSIEPYLLAKNARRIIVTTTEASVAEHCSTAHKNIYKLQALHDAAALELFKSKVLPWHKRNTTSVCFQSNFFKYESGLTINNMTYLLTFKINLYLYIC
jgi:hypothetical protein